VVDADAAGEAAMQASAAAAARARAEAQFRAVTRAYEVLSDPEARERYDASHLSVVRLLLAHGADARAPLGAASTTTPGDVAVRCRRWALASLLVDRMSPGEASGTFAPRRFRFGRTLLHMAASFDDGVAVRQIMEPASADEAREDERVRALLSAVDVSGASPVLAAAAAGGAAVLETLLCRAAALDGGNGEAGAGASQALAELADTSGQTPLIAATCGGHEACVRILAQHGADVGGKDGAGSTAADYAKDLGLKGVATLLAELALR
jgi:ankyrin repeat protein